MVKELIIDGVEYVLTPKSIVEEFETASKENFTDFKQKSNLDLMKKKYESGNYVYCVKQKIKPHNWVCYEYCDLNNFEQDYLNNFEQMLIHKKHKDTLEVVLKNPDIEIFTTYENSSLGAYIDGVNFIENYNEEAIYEIKEEYPQFKKTKSGEIFRFDNKNECTNLLHSYSEFIGISQELSDISSFEIIPYDKEGNLYYKQPIWCWDNNQFIRFLGFYDAINKCAFDSYGNWDGAIWDNVEPVAPEQLKTMPFIWDMYKQLKD